MYNPHSSCLIQTHVHHTSVCPATGLKQWVCSGVLHFMLTAEMHLTMFVSWHKHCFRKMNQYVCDTVLHISNIFNNKTSVCNFFLFLTLQLKMISKAQCNMFLFNIKYLLLQLSKCDQLFQNFLWRLLSITKTASNPWCLWKTESNLPVRSLWYQLKFVQ